MAYAFDFFIRGLFHVEINSKNHLYAVLVKLQLQMWDTCLKSKKASSINLQFLVLTKKVLLSIEQY